MASSVGPACVPRATPARRRSSARQGEHRPLLRLDDPSGRRHRHRPRRLIVTEGNYLLLEDDPWPSLRTSFDRTAVIVADMASLEARNRQRWVDYGLDEAGIVARLEVNDMPNVHHVYERSAASDWVIRT